MPLTYQYLTFLNFHLKGAKREILLISDEWLDVNPSQKWGQQTGAKGGQFFCS